MRVAIKTLGCKSNRYESDIVFEALKDKHEVYEVNEGAGTFMNRIGEKQSDLLVVNTCTVTHVADRKSRQAIRSFKRRNPDCKVVVFGCASNIAQKEYEAMEEVDYRAENSQDVLNFAERVAKEYEEMESCFYEGNKMESGMRTRALVKIQDGCNSYCSYCIIPFTRGPELSFKSEEILKEVRQKEAEGYQEIVLTGINIGEWKEDDLDLADLFEKLINGTDSVRFRVSSIEPKNFSEKFFELFKTGRFCEHMHMSLQSGSDAILKRMRRNYDLALFYDVCQKFREVIPDIALTTDIIVGFPGETEEEFIETMEFSRKVNFTKIHVFPYSKRKNTAAYHMKNHVSDEDKKLRSRRLRELSDEMELEFRKRMLGNNFWVIAEKEIEGDYYGITSNYVPVLFSGENCDLLNQQVDVEIISQGDDGIMRGRIC